MLLPIDRSFVADFALTIASKLGWEGKIEPEWLDVFATKYKLLNSFVDLPID